MTRYAVSASAPLRAPKSSPARHAHDRLKGERNGIERDLNIRRCRHERDKNRTLRKLHRRADGAAARAADGRLRNRQDAVITRLWLCRLFCSFSLFMSHIVLLKSENLKKSVLKQGAGVPLPLKAAVPARLQNVRAKSSFSSRSSTSASSSKFPEQTSTRLPMTKERRLYSAKKVRAGICS